MSVTDAGRDSIPEEVAAVLGFLGGLGGISMVKMWKKRKNVGKLVRYERVGIRLASFVESGEGCSVTRRRTRPKVVCWRGVIVTDESPTGDPNDTLVK